MKINSYFQGHEIAPPEVHNSGHLKDIWFISRWQIRVSEFFRKRFGETIINDYGFGGEQYASNITYKMSGTRPPNTNVGAFWSQHKFKNALDFKFKHATPDEVREDILKNQSLYLKAEVTTIESGEIADSWVHIDGRVWTINNQREIEVVKP